MDKWKEEEEGRREKVVKYGEKQKLGVCFRATYLK